MHCNQASYEDPEVHGLDPIAAPSQKIWGYETTWGSFAQFTQGPGPAAPAQAARAELGGGRLLRPRVLHRVPHADHPLQTAGRPERADLGRRRRPRRIRDAAVRRCGRRLRRSRVLRREGRAGQAPRRRRLHRPRRVRGHDAHGRRDARRGDRPASRCRARFAKRVNEILGDAPDIVFEHVGKATFPTSVFVVKPFGKVVICAATSGYSTSTSTSAYLWMRQKEILGSHFANA